MAALRQCLAKPAPVSCAVAVTTDSAMETQSCNSRLSRKLYLRRITLNRERRAAPNIASSQPSEKIAPPLLNIPPAATYMGCSIWFVRSIIWGRRIPFVKFGKRYLLDRIDLDKFIDSEKERA